MDWGILVPCILVWRSRFDIFHRTGDAKNRNGKNARARKNHFGILNPHPFLKFLRIMEVDWCSKLYAYNELHKMYKEWDRNAPKLGGCFIVIWPRTSSQRKKPVARIQIDMGVLFLVAYVADWGQQTGNAIENYMYQLCEDAQ